MLGVFLPRTAKLEVRRSVIMATTKTKPAPKQEEKKGDKPTLIARAKQAPGSEYWLTIGAAWEFEKNGEICFSVRLNSIPTNWDHSFVLMPPLPDKT
jgi:hypothetical protein